jgi:hypothetical protein
MNRHICSWWSNWGCHLARLSQKLLVEMVRTPKRYWVHNLVILRAWGLKYPSFSADQHPAIRLISSWQKGLTKGILPAKICLNLNPIYLWPLHSKFEHYTEIYSKTGKSSVVLPPRPTTCCKVDIIFENSYF